MPPPSPLNQALAAYQELSGKTILRESLLVFLSNSIVADLPADKPKALARLESEFAKAGMAMIQDGPLFVRMVPLTKRDFYTNAPLRGQELYATRAQTKLSLGTLNLQSAGIDQFLALYAGLRQRTVLRPATLAASFTLKTAAPLTREEASYAMNTLLALNDFVAVDDGEKFVQVVGVKNLAQVKARAPKPQPGAPIFDPKKPPPSGGATPLTSAERLDKLFYDFVHRPDPKFRAGDRLVAFYAELVGKVAAPSLNLGGAYVPFSVETPLTREELLYGMDTALALNHFAIIPIDENQIRLGQLSELTRRKQ
jgi:hypothetical protein